MGIALLIIIGTAVGFLATRAMRLDVDVPSTIAIGVAGTLIGGMSLRVCWRLWGVDGRLRRGRYAINPVDLDMKNLAPLRHRL